jgi:hypothetical protein
MPETAMVLLMVPAISVAEATAKSVVWVPGRKALLAPDPLFRGPGTAPNLESPDFCLTRAAVQGWTAARERIPNYSATPGRIAERLEAAAVAADRIEDAPAIRLSPDAIAVEIVNAGTSARAADARLIHDTR